MLVSLSLSATIAANEQQVPRLLGHKGATEPKS